MMRRTLAAAATLALAVALAGCSADWLLGGDASSAPSPSASEGPTPSPSDSPTPVAEECADLEINRPGSYQLGECGTVTLEGGGIRIEAASIDLLIIRGDRADVTTTGPIGSIEVSGQGNEISAGAADTIQVSGDRNVVLARGPIGSVVVNGSSNTVTSVTSVGPITESGQDNEISVTP